MPALNDFKHEYFAQLCVEGHPLEDAYQVAGFNPNPGNARRLAKRVAVNARIAELTSEAEAKLAPSLDNISKRLFALAETATLNPDRRDLGLARQALMDIAKLHGIFVKT
jgi:hypothetical protein